MNGLAKSKSYRQIKEELHLILQGTDWENKIDNLSDKPGWSKKLVSPLFSTLYSKSFEIRSRGITCLGIVVAKIARFNIEDARVIMRRLIWNLNDESGGIGWGSPEAQAEIMANNKQLADEFYKILISYIISRDGPDNYLEYEPLREGAYWGLARLSQIRPELIQPYVSYLIQATDLEHSPKILAYLCLTFNNLQIRETDPGQRLKSIAQKKALLTLYWDRSIQTFRLDQLANRTLKQITST